MRPLFNKITRQLYVILTFYIMLFRGCSQSPVGTGENPDFRNAQWITDTRILPAEDSLMYGNIPAPVFRREFDISKEVRSAKLYITAAGYYKATINGKDAGKEILDPAWTNFSKRIYYSEYDITADIRQGKNCLGAVLGNGFYNPLPMRFWSTNNLRDNLPVGKPVFIADLKIGYADGTTAEVNTGKEWKYSYGPVIRNNVYLGEVYNASEEIAGWNLPGFDDSGWNKPELSTGPGGKLIKAFFPPVMITGKCETATVTSLSPDTCIADMGVNFTGLYNIRLRGHKGDTITFRFGERLYGDGSLNPMTSVAGQIKRTVKTAAGPQEAAWHTDNGPGCPPVAWQTDRYIFGDKTDVVYSPEFTFHVFRYMEITGLDYVPERTDIEGLIIHSNVGNGNSFSCSSELINSIQQATRRTFTDNLVSVQSDCPGRERFGYGGDLNATCDAFIYNFDMKELYRKTLYDWVDAMQDSIFMDTAPYVGIKICGLSWESAFIITQYKLLLYYNDTSLIRELYGRDLQWMEKAARLHPSGIVDKGLSDHESLVKVPVMLIGTTHYLDCARIMQRFARMMNDTANERKFGNLAAGIEKSVRRMYWEKPVPDTINRQTLFATLLYYGIVPQDEKKTAVDSLLKALKKAPSGHFTTGIFGTKYILESLSESGKSSSVFDIVNSTSFPGWGFMIGHGATTIWETWKESDNVYSNCHPMFGSVSEWFYRRLAGIQPDPDNPGFRKFTVAPFLPSGLSFVKCSYQSPFGIIKSDWEKTNNGATFYISVPQNTVAAFLVPDHSKIFAVIKNTESGSTIRKNIKESGFRIELSNGNYTIYY